MTTKTVDNAEMGFNFIEVECNAKGRGLNFGLQQNPALRPELVATRFKQVYLASLKGRAILSPQSQENDSVSWIEEGDMTGAVGWLTEEGGFPMLETEYDKKTAAIKSFGSMFYVTAAENRFDKINTAGRKVTRGGHKMRSFEDKMIWDALNAASGVNTFDGSNWTDKSAGTPFEDIEHAKGLIEDATDGEEATDIIMTRTMYERLAKFDFLKNNLYTRGSFIETGVMPKISGLNVMIEKNIDAADDGKIIVLRRQDLGFLAETTPLTVIAVPGLNIPNPKINYVYYTFAETRPVIDSPELMTVITGLKA